jgi:hypothetical protein
VCGRLAVCGRLGYGALAPPVGLGGADSSPFAALSLEAGFSAAAPPEGVASLAGVALEAGSLLSPVVLSPLAGVASLGALVVLVEVVVEVFCAVAASALVFVGGVTSGVLFGTASDTVVPPHPLSVSPHSSAAHAASARRALTAAPYACRTSGSR